MNNEQLKKLRDEIQKIEDIIDREITIEKKLREIGELRCKHDC